MKKSHKELKSEYKRFGIDLDKDNISLYRYEDENGDFDYETYKKAQININKRKIGFSGPQYLNIHFICDHIASSIDSPKFGLCHGTRNGSEQISFKQALKKTGHEVNILGTEISDTATQFPNTIQWDFHNVKEEWKGSVCFIYSNSLDHSYDPVLCLRSWMSCIKDGGKIYLQRGEDDLPSTNKKDWGDTSLGISNIDEVKADIFQAEQEEFEKIVKAAGDNKWKIITPDELIIEKKQDIIKRRTIVLERK